MADPKETSKTPAKNQTTKRPNPKTKTQGEVKADLLPEPKDPGKKLQDDKAENPAKPEQKEQTRKEETSAKIADNVLQEEPKPEKAQTAKRLNQKGKAQGPAKVDQTAETKDTGKSQDDKAENPTKPEQKEQPKNEKQAGADPPQEGSKPTKVQTGKHQKAKTQGTAKLDQTTETKDTEKAQDDKVENLVAKPEQKEQPKNEKQAVVDPPQEEPKPAKAQTVKRPNQKAKTQGTAKVDQSTETKVTEVKKSQAEKVESSAAKAEQKEQTNKEQQTLPANDPPQEEPKPEKAQTTKRQNQKSKAAGTVKTETKETEPKKPQDDKTNNSAKSNAQVETAKTGPEEEPKTVPPQATKRPNKAKPQAKGDSDTSDQKKSQGEVESTARKDQTEKEEISKTTSQESQPAKAQATKRPQKAKAQAAKVDTVTEPKDSDSKKSQDAVKPENPVKSEELPQLPDSPTDGSGDESEKAKSSSSKTSAIGKDEKKGSNYYYFKSTPAELAEQYKPKPLVAAPVEKPANVEGGSAWNRSGTTWEEKDYSTWAVQHITALLNSVQLEKPKVQISDTKCEGQATIVYTRGKKKIGYDLTISATVTGESEGKVQVNSFDESTEDYEVNVSLKSGSNLLEAAVRKALDQFVTDFRAKS